MPPADTRAGKLLLADSTLFRTLFGADDSLERFWNLATATKRFPSPSATSC
jgi:hypothetical protein